MSRIYKSSKAAPQLTVNNLIKAIVRSGQAAPGPPLGPILGQPPGPASTVSSSTRTPSTPPLASAARGSVHILILV
ncbi:hypothetical protein CRUP_023196 [Coryphaenoides rupestris]|nr:hypothetical protein CRUP_023196 [Coryphaenoides rupestris]